MFFDDTIAAIATESYHGGVSIVRISGENAVSCADEILVLKKGKLKDSESHKIHYGYVVDSSGNHVDEVLVLLMKGPNSYTREDVVEIQCHGGVLICREILDLIMEKGVRIAEPGEFTKRAFLNGRIDLSQAEAVMDLIEAKSRYALESSLSQLEGSVKEKISLLRRKILDDVAFIEAALDDPEHISMEERSDEFSENIRYILSELKKIQNNYNNGRMIKEGIRTVILGRPNVGKSSFLNCVLKEDRAIVTDIPGTTRDTLEEDVRLGDIFLRFIDTAGIRNTEDIVEKIGVEKAKKALESADFVILIMDGSQEFSQEDRELLKMVSDHPYVVLLNKKDKGIQIQPEVISHCVEGECKVISFSAKTKDGLEELEAYLKDLFFRERISFNREIYLSNERQKQEITESIISLENVMKSIEMGQGEDFYTIDLMAAYESLGKITGESVDDDLVDTIFKKFCMGK